MSIFLRTRPFLGARSNTSHGDQHPLRTFHFSRSFAGPKIQKTSSPPLGLSLCFVVLNSAMASILPSTQPLRISTCQGPHDRCSRFIVFAFRARKDYRPRGPFMNRELCSFTPALHRLPFQVSSCNRNPNQRGRYTRSESSNLWFACRAPS